MQTNITKNLANFYIHVLSQALTSQVKFQLRRPNLGEKRSQIGFGKPYRLSSRKGPMFDFYKDTLQVRCEKSRTPEIVSKIGILIF